MTDSKGKGTILIVEDDAGVAELERRRLERAGYRVAGAETAEQALVELRQGPFDLILLDYRLPGNVDGLDFYSQVRAAGFDLPVILVTGFSNETTVIRALRAGVRDFVTKSVEYLDYLPEAVDHVLRQVRTEHKLVESEARLTAIIESAQDAIILVDKDRQIELFNSAAERMFGCPASKALGESIYRFIPLATDSASNRPILGDHGRRLDGSTFPVEASVSEAMLEGRPTTTYMVRDVTSRRRDQDALRRSEQQFHQIWDRSLDGMALIDERGVIRLANASFCRMMNKAAHELQGWEFTTALAAENRDALLAEFQLRFAERSIEPHLAQELCRWDNKNILLEVSSTFLQFGDEPPLLLSITRDVTEQRQLEGMYRQAHKMEAVGQLAGGVAHDFNNMLTIITGYCDVLIERKEIPGDSLDFIREIRKAGDRAAILTRQLLAFSRKQMLAPEVLDLNALVSDMEKMLGRLIGEDIDLAASLDPDLGKIKVDRGQIEQVIMNLVVNARDAMPRGGKLTLETHNVFLDDGYVRHRSDINPGWYALLAVTDSGIGMDETTKSHIFEPFFTTKEVGKGTGLGLATVFGVIKQSNGHIDVYSELGRGTTFKIYLPLTEQSTASPSVLGLKGAALGSETILLAEDEEGVRVLVGFALRSFGYNILEAKNGADALALSRRHTGKIHLLLTDLVMPQMSGRQLADEMTSLTPDLKVLYLSGYTDDAVVRHGLIDAKVAFLQKPFTPTVLARKVREILDAK